ncbi:hypothetical protein HYQ45_011309 [Verticillium longisporum]|uniref:AMP-dependent synthetase/ligase domain-containing protein n=1 Tax=Verticillium longisporum TaxID=100787 RepID=A0A8I2ZEN4_VERLO|nr:hypothetical protein HYQ45_011309 [Verticillium longisporum]
MPQSSRPSHPQDDVHRQSLEDPTSFWARQADHLYWHKKPSSTLVQAKTTLEKSGVTHATWSWFPDGQISTCYNCVDRHVVAGHGHHPAIYYDSPVTKTKQTLSYAQLLDEVEVLAGALREEGVKKGDVVLIYMPMIPAALIGILAVSRLGAVHAVVFGGFAPAALAQRIEASRPVVILTASCGIDGAKAPAAYQPLVEEALRLSSHKPLRVVVWQRDEVRWHPISRNIGERNWQSIVKSCRARNIRAACVPVASSDPVYIIHTSGTTGTPKGVRRDAAGHAVGLQLSIKYLFDIHGPGDVIFTASDIGWVVGHSFIAYAPLLAGAATVLYEGKPVGTPDASAFWRVVEEYRVTSMFTAPTALRAIKRDDPDNARLKEIGNRGGLRTLRALFLAGERSEPAIISAYQELLDEYAAPPDEGGSHVIDNWWSTETERHPPIGIKPGSAGKAMPGFDVRIVDDEGNEVPRGTMGNIVGSEGKWVDTGDAGFIDEEGYVSVMSRNDDVLNVSAHRLSSGSLEQAITSHPLVAEACVVGVPDALKGQLPFAFVTLSVASHPTTAVPDPALEKEIQELVRAQVGAIATLGGVVQGKGMIPKTRSGKTLRRVLRELVENASKGDFEKEVSVPSTVEDAAVVDVARKKIGEYWRTKRSEGKAKL